MNHGRIDHHKAIFPFWGRGLIALIVTSIVGPLLGALALPSIEAAASLANGSLPSPVKFTRDLRGALDLTLVVGLPFAVAAGVIIAAIVARRGTISYSACALIAFLVPCVLSFPVMGGLYVLAPFIGLTAALVAVATRALAGYIAKQFAGVAI